MLYFLNFYWCRIFFFCGFIWCNSFLDFFVFCFFKLCFELSIESVWSILSYFSLMVLSQNITIWFINAKENPFRLENDLSVPGRNFQLLVQERVVHLSEKFYFWCIRKGNRYVKHTVSISSVWLLIHPCCAFDPMLEKLLKNFDFT